MFAGCESTTGIVHFYKSKDDGSWLFIKQEDYDARKGELPDLSFAAKYQISDFDNKSSLLPDLS